MAGLTQQAAEEPTRDMANLRDWQEHDSGRLPRKGAVADWSFHAAAFSAVERPSRAVYHYLGNLWLGFVCGEAAEEEYQT